MEKLKNIKAILAIIITIFTIIASGYGGAQVYNSNIIKKYEKNVIINNNMKGLKALSEDNATEHKELNSSITIMKGKMIIVSSDIKVLKNDISNIKSTLNSIDGKLMILLTSKKYQIEKVKVTVQK